MPAPSAAAAPVASEPADAARVRPWLALIRAPGIGPGLAHALLQRFGSPAGIFAAGRKAWQAAQVPRAVWPSLEAPDPAGIAGDLAWLAQPGCGLLTWEDPAYPDRLREITHAPVALFVRGDAALLSRPQLAVVGARAATPQGLETAHAFAAELTRRGLLVTSGLAQGIDGAAHRGALDAGGATVAVCGTGLDRVYPPRHQALARDIAQRGALVSEFPPGTPPLADHFPRRNRILSGLALGVLVVEAAQRSGSLITARRALEQGREVFAIPGSIHNPLSRGTHALIRHGARLTEQADDILDELGAHTGAPRPAPRTRDAPPALEPQSRRVLEAVGFEPTAFDTLVERAALPVEAIAPALLALELDGWIAATPAGQYQRLRRG